MWEMCSHMILQELCPSAQRRCIGGGRELATCLPSSLLLILFLFPYLLSLLFHRPGIRLIGETELSSWLDPTSIIKFGNLGGEGRG